MRFNILIKVSIIKIKFIFRRIDAMIKNIIFDLGKVLLDYDPYTYLEKKIPKDICKEVYEDIFLSNEWVELDRGTISEKQAILNIISRNKHIEKYIADAFDNWYELLKPIKKNIDILKRLKEKNYNVYYLSNFHDLAFQYVNKHYSFFKLFDGGIVSYREKLLKPEKEIYIKIVNTYSLKPEECLFIDDTEKNIDAAKKLKINGIHLDNVNKLESYLNAYDICL